MDECKPLVKGKGLMRTSFVEMAEDAVKPAELNRALIRITSKKLEIHPPGTPRPKAKSRWIQAGLGPSTKP